MPEPKWTPRTVLVAAIGAALIGGGTVLGGWLLAALFTGFTSDPADLRKPAPEPAVAEMRVDGEGPPPPSFSRDFMSVAAHPAAAQTGARILSEGGNAIDAMIAAQMVLNLVEPQSSGIGGGAFLLYWDAGEKRLYTYDGRETAPMAADGTLFVKSDGSEKGYFEALKGGRSVGVPGLLRMLEMAHDAHGARSFAGLLEPAALLAEKGFPISPRLHGLLERVEHLGEMPAAARFFYSDDGMPWPVGHMLRNPAFAETLRTIQRDGVDAFYDGPIAEAIVTAVRDAPANPGVLSLEDMRTYQAKRRDNLCAPYRIFTVCGMPPPSSGGLATLQILGLLEQSRIGLFPPTHPQSIQRFAEAMRFAHADRDRYIGDTDFVDVPVAGMLDRNYLATRAGAMDFTDAVKGKAPFGFPPGAPGGPPPAEDAAEEPPSTTHLSMVDAEGNVAVMTSSVEFAFGSGVWVKGFLLNNQLTDFAWPSTSAPDGGPHPNRMQPGKRPRSSMSPTIVLAPHGRPRLAIGSPGGSRIIGYTAKTIVGVLDWELNVQEAIEVPHFLNRNGPLELEADSAVADLAGVLRAQGYEVEVEAMTSGLHGVEMIAGELTGGADPRREGRAVGGPQLEPGLYAGFDRVVPDFVPPVE
ncbi:gamma-glutamyltransferase [Marivibrio halodurans]|uniref:Glutathione hydrolase proenzyme n=1 Tax=Marivibrio halodurans TaxID=2039722 RepID=A0A8J7RWT6_9PROT|nr:gamma-glutamyltransferase [Marivibrio halodurans]MBP5855965.1 gamma-glutamyltransferase [Marivibrio halodurans]